MYSQSESRLMLIYLAVKYKGDVNQILTAMLQNEKVPYPEAENIAKSLPCKAITLLDYDYPSKLKHAYNPPIVLFYYGDITLLDDNKRKLGVVGSRECSEYGRKATAKLVGGLARDAVIVSGLAYGIDGAAHQATIDNNGRTIAVLGSGIDYCYPDENRELYESIKKNHLLISEYPGMTTPDQDHFPMRNRIIVALSDALLVPQINTYKSGTNISIGLAIQSNKTVMAIPHPIDEGFPNITNKLLNEGAALVESSDDIKDELDW